jgi:hypothetical protein
VSHATLINGSHVACMEYAKLETAALAHVDDSYYYGAYCRKCKHSSRLSLVTLRKHLGDGFPLAKVKDRLRCERCSSIRPPICDISQSELRRTMRLCKSCVAAIGSPREYSPTRPMRRLRGKQKGRSF